jgi:deoxycytidylate deaminase
MTDRRSTLRAGYRTLVRKLGYLVLVIEEEVTVTQTELVVGLVGAVGTKLTHVTDELRAQLDEYDYTVTSLRLSSYLQDLPWAVSSEGRYEDERIWLGMDAGTRLRQETDHDDALALWAISDIVIERGDKATDTIQDGQQQYAANLERHAWILRSLKTPAEVATLRAVYGPRFVLFAAYSSEKQRIKDLAAEIRLSRGNNKRSSWAYRPEQLIERDLHENLTGGQDVEETYHQADFFIDASDPATLEYDIVRSLEILFGHPFRTPTRDEFAQFQARGAAVRSAELGRQVGAAIVRADGSVVSLGTNEVPRAGGGSHWEEDGAGNREFEVSDVETNRHEQQRIANELANMLRSRLSKNVTDAGIEAADDLERQFGEELEDELLRKTLRDLTEFGRAVHAEMDALLDAARRGVPVQGCILHCTTFPCHNCARHIIAAGIQRVVFVEPYSKSRALDLHASDLVSHDDVLASEEGDDGLAVRLVSFRGTAPRRYLELFDLRARERVGQARKDDQGRTASGLDKAAAVPLFSDLEPETFRPALPAYRRRETLALASFENISEQLIADAD